MAKDSLASLYAWFKGYVSKFYSEEPIQERNIKLKEAHTYRVAKNIVEIGKSLDLTEKQLYLAEIIGLFHDIGRFEQFKTYRTFKDGQSENHALLGIKVLEQEKVFFSLGEQEKNLILTAIVNHNVCNMPSNCSQEEMLYIKLIRDADKMDIFLVLSEYYRERYDNPNPALEELPNDPGYSQVFVDHILQKKNSRYEDVKSFNDMTLLRLGWIFDINFDYTLRVIASQDYLEEFIKSLPDTPQIREVYDFLKNYLIDKKNNS